MGTNDIYQCGSCPDFLCEDTSGYGICANDNDKHSCREICPFNKRKENTRQILCYEPYVSYRTAEALRKAGFDWECDHYYLKKDFSLKKSLSANNYNASLSTLSAPSLWVARKWVALHTSHHIYTGGDIYCYKEEKRYKLKGWLFHSLIYDDNGYASNGVRATWGFATEEEALENGISTVLDIVEKEDGK